MTKPCMHSKHLSNSSISSSYVSRTQTVWVWTNNKVQSRGKGIPFLSSWKNICWSGNAVFIYATRFFERNWAILQSRAVSSQCPIESIDEWIYNHQHCSNWAKVHGSRTLHKAKFYCVTLSVKHIQCNRLRVCWNHHMAVSKLMWNRIPWLPFDKIPHLLNRDNSFGKWNSYWNYSGGLICHWWEYS